MPAQRPRASFEPIPPDFNIRDLVEDTPNFQYADRISCEMIAEQGIEQFEKLVLLHVVIGGKPLVIDSFQEHLDPWTFTPRWLKDNHGGKVENARNLSTKENLALTIGHYLDNMGLLTDQYFERPDNYRDKNRQRVYLKDIDCPPVWQEKLKEHIPASLFYWNDSTGEVGGPGAVDEPIPNATGRRKGKGIAIAGDLMSSLPLEMRAENLMCYIGHEGTYTPAHREMCATLGHNIMVEASGNISQSGKPEKPGSSIWFMTETKDRHLVAEYWLSVLGHDIEVESHFAQIVAWKRAPFKTYIVEQKAGDFILIPPLAPHQVWNCGTRTMKIAWNRTTVETLEMALHEALPNARVVCRDEQYKNKAIVHYTLLKYSSLLKSAKMQAERSAEQYAIIYSSKKIRQVQKDFKRLFKLFREILLSEMFSPDKPKEHPEYLAFDSNVTCAYCRGNIFNRFLTCKSCAYALGTDAEEPYDVCMECYAMGRSCACQSNYKWVEQWKWKDLVHRYDEWRKQIEEYDTQETFLPLQEERKLQPKRTLAEICQEQLKLRPWVDIKNPEPAEEAEKSEEEIQVNDDGTVKKLVRKRSKAWLKSHQSCHVCLHRHPKWKMAICTMCERGWCYGTLFRGYDIMPQTIMEDPNWECPHCRKICNAGACRKDPRQHPYEPKGTLLGHDTRKVADVRSVECLVDFSKSNLNWLQEPADPHAPLESSRLARRREEAEQAKLADPSLDHHYVDDEENGSFPGSASGRRRDDIEYSPEDANIDPGLSGAPSSWRDDSFIDPSLRDNQPNGDSLPSFSALCRSERPGNDSPLFASPYHHGPGEADYDEDSGYIAPSAVIFQHTDGAGEDDSLYPDPNRDTHGHTHGPTSTDRPRKRPRTSDEQIKLVESKKRKVAGEESRPSLQLKTQAGKQYQKEQERKQLEEARKQGRFIAVLAAMRGRKKIVQLSVPKEKLAELRAKDIAQRKQARLAALGGDGTHEGRSAVTNGVLLQSDVAVPGTGAPKPLANKPKPNPNQVRYRVEDDEDFDARSRRRAKAKKPQYEEINVASDEDEDMMDVSASHQQNGSSHRRRSPWLARKNRDQGDDEEDAPSELPPGWKDGRSSRREKDRERRATLPKQRRAQAQKAPSIRPLRASTGNISISDADGSPDADAGADVDAEGEVVLDEFPIVASPPPQPPAEPAAVEVPAEVPVPTGEPVRVAPKGPKLMPAKTIPSVTTNDVNDTPPAAAAIQMAKSAAAVLEENRRAKLQAAAWAEGANDDGFESDSVIGGGGGGAEDNDEDAEAYTEKPVVLSKPSPATARSIFSRPGMQGKKIKIVSAATKAKRLGGTGTAAMTSTTTTVMVAAARKGTPGSGRGRGDVTAANGEAGKVVVDNAAVGSDDSDSENEIPAKPVPRAVRGRGRPSLRGR